MSVKMMTMMTAFRSLRRLLRKFVDRIIQREIIFTGDRPYHIELLGLTDLSERHYGAVCNRFRAVRDYGVHVDIHNDSQALAVVAIALRRVE